MNRLFLVLIGLIITVNIWAQAAQKINYQIVIRNGTNGLVINTQVGVRLSILKGTADGQVVYTESLTPTTNENGLATIEIGGETGFEDIDWSNGSYFIKTETDPSGGTNYTLIQTNQIMTVPYALYAKTAESYSGTFQENDPYFQLSAAKTITSSDTASWNNKLNNLVAGKGIIISGNVIRLDTTLYILDKDGRIIKKP